MQISVLTYNIHKAIGADRRCEPDRIARVCADQEADIIALQEVDNGVPRSGNVNLAAVIAEKLGFHYRLGTNVQLKTGAYGNAILSRWPISFDENINLTWTIKKRRGCLATVVDSPAGKLLAMNFHLGLSRIERHFQIKIMLESEILREHTALPAILLGDSNERTRYMDIFMNIAGYRNTAGALKRKIKTWPAFAPIWNLDKIFCNSFCSVGHYEVIRNPMTRVASDHLPVKAIIHI